jgi:hypothetical protein
LGMVSKSLYLFLSPFSHPKNGDTHDTIGLLRISEVSVVTSTL